PLLRVLFGREYASHGDIVMRLLAPGLLAYAVVSLGVAMARVRRQLSRLLVLSAVYAAVSLPVSIALVSTYGIGGAGAAWLASQLGLAAIAGAIWSRGLFDRPAHLRSNYPPAGASVKRGRRLPAARSPFWPALIGGSLILLTFVVLSEQSGGAVTYSASFTATEDTYVKSTRPSTNYGQDTTLQADMKPSIKRALIRFSLTGIPSNATIQSATLRLFVVDRSNQSGSIQRVNGSWDENTTRWANAPAVGQRVAIIPGAAQQNTWKEANVLPAVTGNGRVDFYILTGSTDGVDYASSENLQYQPRLNVRCSVPTSAPSPTAQPTPTAGTPDATSAPAPIAGVGT